MRPALLAVWLVAAIGAACPLPAATARTLHVDAGHGDDAHDGLSAATAWRSLQAAARAVQAGDTVLVAPGVYYGPVEVRAKGSAQAPIRFLAREAGEGRVTITNADPAIREKQAAWTCVDAATGLYAIACGRGVPARVLAGGIDLYPYADAGRLASFTTNSGQPGPRHGYAYDPAARRLYVRLHPDGRDGGRDPNAITMCAAPATGKQFDGTWIDTPEHFNLGVLGPGPAHVIVDGFTFETPGVAGVYVQADHVTVRRCWFRGCRTGVGGNYSDILADGNPHGEDYHHLLHDPAGAARAAAAITIEYSDFSQHPAFEDVVELLGTDYGRSPAARRSAYWHRKSTGSGLPSEHFKYEIGIACRIGRDWVIRRNQVHDAFEGLSCHATSASDNLLVEENVFARLCDNAVEAEDHARNLQVVRNVIVDVFEPFSYQPVRGLPWPGPVAVRNNIITSTPRFAGLWRGAADARGAFKIGISLKGWDAKPGLKDVPRSPLAVPGSGMQLTHNTVLLPGCRLVTVIGDLAVPLDGVLFADNVFATDALLAMDPARSELPAGHFAFARNAVAPATPGRGGPTALAAGTDGAVFASPAQFALDASFRPDAGSPLRGGARPVPVAGPAQPDLGAIQPGDTWFPLQAGPSAAPPPGRVLHVDAGGGDDRHDGLSPQRAFASIQRAADLVAPGDEVVIHPGVYGERVRLATSGTAQRPIVFRADAIAKGRVVLSGADMAIRRGRQPWTLVDGEAALYRLPYAGPPPIRLLYSGTDLYPYATLDALRSFTTGDHGGPPGPRHGYAHDRQNGHLYVRLNPSGRCGPSDPNRHTIALAAANSYGFSLPADRPAHVVIEGITFETPGNTAIHAGAGQLTVRHSWFVGCPYGVRGLKREDGDRSTDQVTIEHCDYSDGSSFADADELIREPGLAERHRGDRVLYWHRKSAGMHGLPPGRLNYETGLTACMGRGWTIRRNYLHDTFEGLCNDGMNTAEDVVITENVFARMCDNAIETENHARNVDISRNLFLDIFEPFSWQPLAGPPWAGPVFFHQNLIITTPAHAAAWARAIPDHANGVFKLGISLKNWRNGRNADLPRSPLAAPDPGLLFFNNTISFPGGRLITLLGDPQVPIGNVHFAFNLIATGALISAGTGAEQAPGGFRFTRNLVAPALASEPGPGPVAAGEGGQVLACREDLGWPQTEATDFAPGPGSPARDAGGQLAGVCGGLRHAGALQGDDGWYPLRVGPNAAVVLPAPR